MRKLFFGGGVLTLLVLSFTTKANNTSLPLPVPAVVSFTNNDVSDKLAADAKFTELISLIGNTESKIRTLSLKDKKLFRKYAEEKNIPELSKFYTKCGIDYKQISSQKMDLISELDKKYALNKRSDT